MAIKVDVDFEKLYCEIRDHFYATDWYGIPRNKLEFTYSIDYGNDDSPVYTIHMVVRKEISYMAVISNFDYDDELNIAIEMIKKLSNNVVKIELSWP